MDNTPAPHPMATIDWSKAPPRPKPAASTESPSGAKSRKPKMSFAEEKRAVIAGLNVCEEFAWCGIQDIQEVRENGIAECRAYGRDDNSLSGYINEKTGFYEDSGGDEPAYNLFDFAVKAGRFSNFEQAYAHFAKKAGVKIARRGKKGAAEDPKVVLRPEPWHAGTETSVVRWALDHKKGVTLQAVKDFGGFVSNYPYGYTTKSGEEIQPEFRVVCIPIYGVKLLDADPVGYACYNLTGGPLFAKSGGKRKPIKMKTVGIGAGLIGLPALQAIKADAENIAAGRQSQIDFVWKLEGPSCAMATYASQPPLDQKRHPILTMASGSKQGIHEDLLKVFAPYRVRVLHDDDPPGQEGAKKSQLAIAKAGSPAVFDVQLPFNKGEGADTRDFLNGHRDPDYPYAAYVELLKLCPPEPIKFTPSDIGQSELFGNVRLTFDEEGSKKFLPRSINEIIIDLQSRTDGWPRAVNGSLFVPHGDRDIRWLDSTDTLFGWIQSKLGVIEWCRGSSHVSKGEFYRHLGHCVEQYSAIEYLPHVPPMPKHYYVWTPPKGDGSKLRGLLEFFCPASDVDASLLLGMFATVLYGGRGGTRPISVLTGQGTGTGKSICAQKVAQVAGKLMLFSHKEEFKEIVKRMLSGEGLKSRVAIVDNIKTNKFSSAEIEGLVTGDVISGHEMYEGEGSRPNNVCWIFTLNGVSLSRDLAERSIVINLNRPTYSTTWSEDIDQYIKEHRDAIIGDLIAFYDIEPVAINRPSRWGAWERSVVSRLPNPNECMKVIAERQVGANADADDIDHLLDEFERLLTDLHFDPDNEKVHIPNHIAALWWRAATQQGHSHSNISRIVEQWNQEGVTQRLRVNKCRRHGRGIVWWGEHVDEETTVAYSLETRLEQLKIETSAKYRRGSRAGGLPD